MAKQQIKSAVHVVINGFSDPVSRKYASDYAHRVDYGITLGWVTWPST